MIAVSNLTLAFNKRILFKNVNLKFTPGNCYGLIGANGAGKSTFLKILSGEIEQNEGEIIKDNKARLAFLNQNQFAFDEFPVLETVIMGHKTLYNTMKERDEIYAKEDFSEADGLRASEIEEEFEKLNGYEAESEAAVLLKGLGLDVDKHQKTMKELEGGDKVRVLLAQALFGNPDILLLDEPTNNLDLESIQWLENFLINKFNNTVIVVSHDRHFLNNVCTHIADIDFGEIRIYPGNYDFWFMASALMIKQKRDENKKKEDKAKELKEFIERFSSNASKSRQATSRKKILEKLNIEDIPQTTRKFPYVNFKPERECGKAVLAIENLCKTIDGEKILDNFNLTVKRGDKIALVGPNNLVKTTLFQILSGEMEADSGKIEWGSTISMSYFPKENSKYFENDMNLVDWLRRYSPDPDETYVRGFLGRMLFTGEESQKKASVLSGGEKVRCMLSKMMLSGANMLMLDEPTNHLDLESITSLNNALIDYPEVIIFSSHDHQFINTIANRIIEIAHGGVIDRVMTFDEYIANKDVQVYRDALYHGHQKFSM